MNICARYSEVRREEAVGRVRKEFTGDAAFKLGLKDELEISRDNRKNIPKRQE